MSKQPTLFDSLSPTQLSTYQELFSFFDKNSSGTIPMQSVPMYIRGLGHCPTESEMHKILQSFGAPKNKQVSFHDLLSFLVKRPKEQNIEDELIDAFASLQASLTSSAEANKHDSMQINYAKKKLSEAGQPFNQAQLQAFNQFISGYKIYQQQFKYVDVSKVIANSYTYADYMG